MPRAGLARLLAVIWVFTSVKFIAYFTPRSLLPCKLRGEIYRPDDLPGKRVASVQGSTSALLKLKESGTYDQLHRKWFGESAGQMFFGSAEP